MTTITFDLPDTSALDDVTTDDDVLAHAYSRAAALALGKAARQEKRSRATAQRVTAKRNTYEPIPDEIQSFLTAHPAF